MNTQFFTNKFDDSMYLRVQWLMIVRLIAITITLTVGFLVFNIPLDSFYEFIAFYYLISVLYIILLQRSKHFAFLGFFQITIDIIAITSIVAYAGPVDSVFPNLYILVIILSIIVFPKYGGAVTAAVSVIMYISTILYLFLNSSSEYINILGGPKVTFYVAYIYVTIFIAVGYLANYLSKILREKTSELEQLAKQSSYVFRHINTGLLIINKENNVTYANNAALNLLSANNEHIDGIHWQTLFDTDHIDSIILKNMFENSSEIELVAKSRNAKDIPVAVSFSNIKDYSNKINFKIILFRDLRLQKLNEQKLLEAERLKAIANLSATVAHEIGNPLASISGSAELMLTNAIDDKQKHLLQIICKEVDRLTDIVTDFLSFTRLRSIELTTFDLNNLIMDVVVLLHHSKQFPDNMKLLFNELSEPFYIMADEKQLKQAFLNIGLNALEAMPNGGKLEITLTPSEKHDSIEIQISDSGGGIPKKSLNNIFDSFFTTKNSGSGIGLYVTQKIVHSHRGKISVKSSPEEGTVFYITLPTNIKHSNEQL